MVRQGTARPLLTIHGEKGSHKTKKQVKERQDQDKAVRTIGVRDLVCPDFVRASPIALAKWNEVIEVFAGADFDVVSSGDVPHLARYCQAWAEYLDLVTLRERVRSADGFTWEEEKEIRFALDATGPSMAAAAKLWEQVEMIMSVQGMLKIDAAINAKMKALSDMEDRAFLNPLAKTRNVARVKPSAKARDPLDAAGFGGI